ncbi:vitelline membrane outer layer protein 1 homolog [Hyperolius riggenbachi]|uniref:vitelline membrane outer layer protein 1 homolog n=1 Tax=Hyperolius riggenbachi TaxID=752182 RepID=UPI0035A38BD5
MLPTFAVTLLLLQATQTYSAFILVENGGPWGGWGGTQSCPEGTSARGFSLLVESPQGRGDDTALNAIKLYCAEPYSTTVKATVTSSAGGWGHWTRVQWCPSGDIVSFSLKVEQPIDGDDTAANNIMFQCSDLTILTGDGGPWGDFGGWSDICYSGVCGIRTRVEGSQGKGDDTSLNDVQLRCC